MNKSVCDLCGLALPSKPPSTEWNHTTYQFCCSGCCQVFIILAESGLLEGDFKRSDIYQTSLKLGIIAQPQEQTPAQSEKADKVAVDAEIPRHAKTLTLHINGMWCAACSWLIDSVLSAEEGVLQTQVLFAADTAKITYLPQTISAESIKNRINQLGYRAVDRHESTNEALKERNQLLLRMGIAVFLAINIMMLNAVIYIGYFEEVSVDVARLILFCVWVLATPAVFWCGLPIHTKAYHSLVAKSPTMESLLSLGILSAYCYSVYMFFLNDVHVYFDTAASLVALVLVGKFFETSARHKAAGGIHRLYEMLPTKVRIKTSYGEKLTNIPQLQIGDIFVVKPGEKIPSDGVIVKGSTSVDESLLTGESRPIHKSQGMAVVGASMNLNGRIEVQAHHIGDDTTLSKIIGLVENALSSKSPVEVITDRISKWFIPFVLIIGLATLISVLLSGNSFETALLRGLTVLVIACPCALGIATPLAIMAGIGYAARQGILIRDGSVLQNLAKLTDIFFDKTGTITTGKFSVLEQYGLHDTNQGATFALLGSLETASNHPIAASIVQYCQENNLEMHPVQDVVFYEGLGLIGIVKGSEVAAGNRQLFERLGIALPQALLERGRAEESQGNTVIFYHCAEGQDVGMCVLGDQVHKQAAATIAQLKRQKLTPYMISGDSENTTRTIASHVGITNYFAELSPDEKIKEIQDIQSASHVVGMVGDGINDAPSLAQADIGMAIGSGTELAIESSDIILLHNDLRHVWDCYDISKRTIRTIKQNLVWAVVYNSFGLVAAVMGYLNPLMAASAMLVSRLSVVLNSLRLHQGPGRTRRKIIEILLPWIESEMLT